MFQAKPLAWAGGVKVFQRRSGCRRNAPQPHRSTCTFITSSCGSYETANPARLLTICMSRLSTVMMATMGELLLSTDLHEPSEELGAEALTLAGVGDENGELRLIRAPQLHQA